MKRKLFSLLILLCLAVTAMAVPAKRGQWRTITLADGTKVLAELRGDEHRSYYKSREGKVFKRFSGNFQEVVRSEEWGVQPSSRQMVALPRKVDAKNVKCLCILVQFKDLKFQANHDKSVFENLINKVGYTNTAMGHVGSVRDYFLDQSDGQLNIDFDVVGPYTLPLSYSYYGKDTDEDHKDVNVYDMITKAIDLANPDVNFKDYDWDGDGTCEPIYILYAGKGEADGGDDNTVWPHASSIRKRVDGVYVQSYACGSELNGLGSLCGIGTMCHEYSHCLGLPDIYDIDYLCDEYGTGYWDIMDAGCYNGDGNIPSAYNAFERLLCGWRDPIKLTYDCEVTGIKPITSGGDAYYVENDANENELYLVEYRSQEGFDAGLYGSGLIAYHIDYDPYAWAYNVVNCSKTYAQYGFDHPHFKVVAADNSYGLSSIPDIAGDAYPYNGNNALSDYSTPATDLFNSNTDGTKHLGKAITNITRHEDGTMSFTFTDMMKEVPIPDGSLFYESFLRCYGKGGNDGSAAPSTTATITTDRSGWELSNCASACQCLQLGSSSTVGAATTPEIQLTGAGTLTFRAFAIDSTNPRLLLSVKDDNATLSAQQVIVPQGAWQTYSIDITDATSPIRIQFRAPMSGLKSCNRIFLDDITVTPTNPDGITELRSNTPTARRSAWEIAPSKWKRVR